MKKLTTLLFLTGCITGSGTFSGKLVDASWEGLIFKTCEFQIQVGNHLDKTSSPDHQMCQQLNESVGKDIVMQYDTTMFECFTCDTHYMVRSFK